MHTPDCIPGECDPLCPGPQVGDEVVIRGTVTQRGLDWPLKRDIVQVTRDKESYWFAKAEHVEVVGKSE